MENSLLISTCGQSFTKPIFYPNELINDCRDFIEIEIVSDKIIKEYLYSYLNSNKGLAEIEYFSNGNLFITPENMEGIRIPVPSIKSQKEIVKAVDESNEFFKSIKILRNEFQDNILDYKHMMKSIKEFRGIIEIDKDTGEIIRMNKNWRHVYDRLIWPLAITYLSATRGGFEKTDKANKYLIEPYGTATTINTKVLIIDANNIIKDADEITSLEFLLFNNILNTPDGI